MNGLLLRCFLGFKNRRICLPANGLAWVAARRSSGRPLVASLVRLGTKLNALHHYSCQVVRSRFWAVGAGANSPAEPTLMRGQRPLPAHRSATLIQFLALCAGVT